jgi:hypothetical protein
MNKDDILRMASESGLSDGPVFFNGLERFAALVAAHERDALTNKIIDKITNKISKMLEEKFHE